MLVNRKIYRYVLMTALFVFAPAFGSAQDLGSSNSLFNAPNPKTKSADTKTTSRKTAAKKAAPTKTSVAAKRNVSKSKPKITAKGKTGGKSTRVSKKPVAADKQNSSSAVPKTEPVNNTAVKVEQPAPQPVYDEFFERAIDEGNAARDQREYVKAEGAYLRAQSLATKDSRAIYGLGNLYSDQQRWEEAERAYRAATQLEPTSPEAYIALISF